MITAINPGVQKNIEQFIDQEIQGIMSRVDLLCQSIQKQQQEVLSSTDTEQQINLSTMKELSDLKSSADMVFHNLKAVIDDPVLWKKYTDGVGQAIAHVASSIKTMNAR